MFGRHPDGSESPAPLELVRLAMPRRVYTQAHADYIVECFESLRDDIDNLGGYEITWEPSSLRHFTAKLRPMH
jgi:tyrosine phenol-lyase